MSGTDAAASASASAAAAASPAPATPARWRPELLDNYDAILFDCDGVLWHENAPVPGAPATLRRLQSLGKRLLFATNNSGKSREAYLSKFGDLGFDCRVTPEDIFTSSQATAHFLANLPSSSGFDPKTQAVLTVGEAGIAEELRKVGLRCIESRVMFGTRHLPKSELSALEIDPSIGCVVVGIDSELTYTKMAFALAVLSRLRDGKEAPPSDELAPRAATAAAGAEQDPQQALAEQQRFHALFVSTNQDSTLPTAGHTLPGAGSCVAMLATASGRTPLNIGKPEQPILRLALEAAKLDPRRVLMVGDRLDTDVLFGLRGGVDALLVTATGIHNLDDVKRTGIVPTFALDDVTQMLAPEQ